MTRAAYITFALENLDLKSVGFIVTLYGDVVVPRGGTLWTGSLINICAEVGLSETVVRTAVSRLVAAKKLDGQRAGRRSFYRLDDTAQQEFAEASSLLYAPLAPTTGWQILHGPAADDEAIRSLNAGQMAPQVLIRPDRGQSIPKGILAFHAADPLEQDRLIGFWDLQGLNSRYEVMIQRFTALDQAIKRGEIQSPVDALVMRLLLVHTYRAALLRDPQLPQNILPKYWLGQEARQMFNRLYLALTPMAERHIALQFEGPDGLLAAQTSLTLLRDQQLQQF